MHYPEVMARPAGFEPATAGLAYQLPLSRPRPCRVCGLDYLFAISGAARIVSTEPCENRPRKLFPSTGHSWASLPSATHSSRNREGADSSTHPCQSATSAYRACRSNKSRISRRLCRTGPMPGTSPAPCGTHRPCQPPSRTVKFGQWYADCKSLLE